MSTKCPDYEGKSALRFMNVFVLQVIHVEATPQASEDFDKMLFGMTLLWS